MANYRFINDRSFHINIANRSGRVVDLDLYQGNSLIKTLVSGVDADTVELNTSDDSQDSDHIPLGADYRIRITNQADPSEWSVMSPAPFDMVDDYEEPVPSMLWSNDDGFEFQANGRCYLESLDSTEDPTNGGETASDLYINDPVGGVVGRVHSKRPDGNSLIPDHRMRQSTSAYKPLLSLDQNGRLFWDLRSQRRFELVPAEGAVTNQSAFHFIFAVRANSDLDEYFNLMGDEIRCLFERTGDIIQISVPGGVVTFDSSSGDPDLLDGDVHIIELVIYKDGVSGQSKIRVDQVTKNCNAQKSDLPAAGLVIGYKSGFVDCFDLYSFGMKFHEVTGVEYSDWYNHHLTQAGGAAV